MKGFVRKSSKSSKPTISRTVKGSVKSTPAVRKNSPNLQFKNRKNIA